MSNLTKAKQAVSLLKDDECLELMEHLAKRLQARQTAIRKLDQWKTRMTMIIALLSSYKVVGDYGVSRTGRVAVEYKKRDAPTGLLDETIPWWLFVLQGPEYNGEIAIMIKARRLRRIAIDSFKVNGGDNGTARLALVELPTFFKTESVLSVREQTIFGQSASDYLLKEYFENV